MLNKIRQYRITRAVKANTVVSQPIIHEIKVARKDICFHLSLYIEPLEKLSHRKLGNDDSNNILKAK
jgi:hypothetical protein